jgi:hypothetical protein
MGPVAAIAVAEAAAVVAAVPSASAAVCVAVAAAAAVAGVVPVAVAAAAYAYGGHGAAGEDWIRRGADAGRPGSLHLSCKGNAVGTASSQADAARQATLLSQASVCMRS